jgi:hypothetical protein
LILRAFGFLFNGKFSIFEKEVKIMVKEVEVLKEYLNSIVKLEIMVKVK